MEKIVGEVTLRTQDGNLIRTFRYSTRQVSPVVRSGKDGNESYNKEGAIEAAKTQRARWDSSDQFVHTNLKIQVD